MNPIPRKYVVPIASNLKEFGYPVTVSDVDAALTKIENGENIAGDIIARFTKRMLVEANIIEDEYDSES